MLNSETTTCEEGKDSSPPPTTSPNHELSSSSSPPPSQPKMEPPAPLHHPDPMSLARLHLLNAYRHEQLAYKCRQSRPYMFRIGRGQLSAAANSPPKPNTTSSPEEGWTVPAASDADEYRVRWEGHASHLLQQVARLEQDPASADVTVATKGITLPAHRIVLAAASKFFSSVLQRVPTGQHPVIVVRGADPRHLRCVITFCYTGSVTIPAQDVQQVVKLADDLEISGLKVSCLTTGSSSSNTNPMSTSSPAFPAPGPLRGSRLFRPSSPKRFTFTPIHSASPPTTTAYQPQEDLSSEKRHNSSTFHETQGRKRLKPEPLPVGGEGDTFLSSGSSPISTTPPGSAPPNLPSTSFFGRNHPSPPNSAPPHSITRHPSPYMGDPSTSATIKDEQSPLSLVNTSRLLEPVPLSHRSAPSSPFLKKEFPSSSSPPSPSSLIVPSTPKSLANALKEPLTPSTPNTPTTPNLHGESSNSNRMSLGCSTGCSTGSRVLLWRFLLDLLHNPCYSPIYIRWLDRPAGIFRIMESDMVAQLWGMARKNTNMNYEKMSRGMRTYYKRGILFHIDGTKLIYKFNTSDPEIQQRMRYYDLTQKASDSADSSNEQPSISSQVPSPTLASHLNLSSLPNLTSLPNLPVAVTSSAGSSAIDSFYNPFLRDVPQLPTGLLYDPYITSFLRASQRELF